MGEILQHFLLLFLVTSPLVGMGAVVVVSLRREKPALQEAVVVHALLTAALAALVVLVYRVQPISPETDDETVAAMPLHGGLRWIGDPTEVEEIDKVSDDEGEISLALLPIVRLAWGIDGVGLCYVVLTALVLVPALLVSISSSKAFSEITTATFGLLGCGFGLLGLLVAQDIVWSIVCSGALIGFSALLVGRTGGIERREAMRGMLARLGAGMLAGGLALIGVVYSLSWMQVWGGDASFHPNFVWERVQYDVVGLRYVDPVADEVWQQTAPAIGLFVVFAAGAWLPMFPLHRHWLAWWQQSPRGLQFVWLCVVSNVGLFGLVQFVLPVFGPLETATVWWGGGLGLVGFLYATCVMARQREFIAAVSYGIVAQQGLCFSAFICGERAALWGGVLQIVNVGLSVSLLLWRANVDTEQSAAWWYRVALASLSGVPGTLGFASQVLIVWGLFNSPVSGALVLAVVIGIVFGGRIWHRVSRLPTDRPPLDATDNLPLIGQLTATGYVIITAGLLIVCGVQPGLLLDRIRSSTEHLALAGSAVEKNDVADALKPSARGGEP